MPSSPKTTVSAAADPSKSSTTLQRRFLATAHSLPLTHDANSVDDHGDERHGNSRLPLACSSRILIRSRSALARHARSVPRSSEMQGHLLPGVTACPGHTPEFDANYRP